MPGGVVVIGTRTVNLPFALAGARVRAPAAGGVTEAFKAAQADGTELVLLAPECASELAPSVLESARRAGRPLVLLLPGPAAAQFDIRPGIRRALGLEA